MSTELSTSTRALLQTARNDAPSDAVRAKILGGIASATGVTGGAATISIAAKAATGGTKLLLTGALFGSALTIGVAAFVLGVAAPRSRLAPDPSFAMHADPEIAPVAPAMRATPAQERDAVPPGAPVKLHAPARTHATVSGEDSLAREATLVSEARGALMRGQADTALGALRATELLPSRAMEPEELSLEARALRALGRAPEADFVESQLKARFPDNALSR